MFLDSPPNSSYWYKRLFLPCFLIKVNIIICDIYVDFCCIFTSRCDILEWYLMNEQHRYGGELRNIAVSKS